MKGYPPPLFPHCTVSLQVHLLLSQAGHLVALTACPKVRFISSFSPCTPSNSSASPACFQPSLGELSENKGSSAGASLHQMLNCWFWTTRPCMISPALISPFTSRTMRTAQANGDRMLLSGSYLRFPWTSNLLLAASSLKEMLIEPCAALSWGSQFGGSEINYVWSWQMTRGGCCLRDITNESIKPLSEQIETPVHNLNVCACAYACLLCRDIWVGGAGMLMRC